MSDQQDNESVDQTEQATELVMKAEGSTIHIWVVVGGEDVYHAAPHVAMSREAIQAAVKTFYSRAFADHIPDLADLEDDENDRSGLRGVFQ